MGLMYTRVRAHASDSSPFARAFTASDAQGPLSLSSLIIHLILFGRPTRPNALYLGLDSHGDAFKRISRETIAPRHFACAPKEKISLSLQSLAFLILYYINKARAVESERSFTVFGETEEDGKRSFAD